MNMSEAKAVSRVLRWLICDRDVSVRQARQDAAWLAGRSHQTLAAGITAEQVAERWLRPAVDTSPAAALDRIAVAITQWRDGELAPHDALTEIEKEVRDRCA